MRRNLCPCCPTAFCHVGVFLRLMNLHQDFIVFTLTYMPTVHLIKCCIYRHFKSTAQTSSTLFLIESSYCLVSEMQKSMHQDFQLYYSFLWSSHWEFRHHLLNHGNCEVLSLLVHNSKKYFPKLFFAKKISFDINTVRSTSLFNVIFVNVKTSTCQTSVKNRLWSCGRNQGKLFIWMEKSKHQFLHASGALW